MWIFHNFSITRILREINIGDSKSAKTAILTHLEALNFNFREVLHFLKAEMYQNHIFRAFKIAKMAFFDL